jgi:large subunit ribosomal protein L17
MRHRKDHRKLSRTSAHRKALLRNLVTALFDAERIRTSLAKAKEARRVAERMITFAKRGDVAARRHVHRFVMRPVVVKKLFETVAPWYAERAGGYTRIIRLGPRLGDAGEMVYLELVKSEAQKEAERKVRIQAEEAKGGGGKAPKGERARTREKAPAVEEKPQKSGGKRGAPEEGGPAPGPARRRGPRKAVPAAQ